MNEIGVLKLNQNYQVIPLTWKREFFNKTNLSFCNEQQLQSLTLYSISTLRLQKGCFFVSSSVRKEYV